MALLFQVVNWHAGDVLVEDDDEDDEELPPEADKSKYIIKLFGVDESGKSISVSVTNFTPHFYVKINKPFSQFEIEKLSSALRFRMNRFKYGKMDIRCMRKKDFWGFTNNKEFSFLRFCFDSHGAMKMASRVLTSDTFKSPVEQRKFTLYESNIEPFVRFAHIQNIQPAGWVKIQMGKYQVDDVLPSKCAVDVRTKWQNVEHIEKESIAPMLIASFDLECTSSDGDFPVAAKNYKKIATDIYNIYFESIKKLNLDEYEAKKRMINHVVELFEDKMVIPKRNVSKLALRTIMAEHIDHLCNIIKGDRLLLEDAFVQVFHSHFKKATLAPSACLKFYTNLKGEKDKTATALRKAVQSYLNKCFDNLSKDRHYDGMDPEDAIEELIKIMFGDKDGIIYVLNHYMNMKLPNLKGDEIIQIGMTFHRYGEQEVNRKMIFSLGTCTSLEGIEVIECKTEEEMILEWVNVVNESDPDIITGYNILGFDFSYLNERGIELGISRELCKIGRLRDIVSVYKEQKLSSSALGDNLMKYINMEGRTIIDLMKVVQREHKLDSYKLDAVASHFMGLKKHDVSPQDIFNLYKEGPEQRSIIADYCVQDCALCNKLMMKLEIIANNVGMANVCSVPMSWIFLRGQGVKIFSLVAKQCKKDNFLIPVVSKPNKKKVCDEDSEEPETEVEPDGYEGAIVLEPKTGIYIDTPISVLDYASLYPSSMISENLSHDAIVLDEKYNNLPGVEYLDISYDIYDGFGDEKKRVGEKVCRFVQPQDGKKGVIPNILNHLLKQRKITRKKIGMKRLIFKDGQEIDGFYKKGSGKCVDLTGEETELDDDDVLEVKDVYDNFQKAVLDGLQLAYKITANSLYGQMGASTSPLYMKSIAACTTATGRKMILLAKDFVEKEYGAEVIYGDSVTGYTPTILKYKGQVLIETFENIANRFGENKWIPCREEGRYDKEACELTDLYAWTDEGWSIIKRIIRHQLSPHKKIIRVITHRGCLDVTDDHSLFTPDGKHISPKDLNVGDNILHHPCPYINWSEHQNLGNSLNNAVVELSVIPYEGFVYDFTTDNHKFQAGIGDIIASNTDSIFVSFPKQLQTDKGILQGKDAVQMSLDTGNDVSRKIKPLMKSPHDLEMEKVFHPMILFSKKRYCANKYDYDVNKFQQISMGIALKRRDNANIVKIIYGGVIDIILNKHDVRLSIKFLKDSLQDLINGKFPLEDLVITKTLKAHYKDPDKIAHKVLADRIKERSPGSAPQVNDRIPFVYVQVKDKSSKEKVLQGDRIEHPDYIREKKLKPDYTFYLTNQIMNPVLQLYALILEDLDGYRKPAEYWKTEKEKLQVPDKSEKKIREKLADMREQEVKKLLFDPILNKLSNEKKGQRDITDFFKLS